MRILVDTNICLDILQKRSGLFQSSRDALILASNKMKDFEDAVQAHCAKNHGINLIITRNIKDFVNSPVKAMTPEDFLNIQ